jgi:Na+/phosphate symporter
MSGKTAEGSPASPATLSLAANVGTQIAAILAAAGQVVVVQTVHFLEVTSKYLSFSTKWAPA